MRGWARWAPALAPLVGVLLSAACATAVRPSRQFLPATDSDVREALAAWTTAWERAAALPPSRLLYDARLGSSGVPAIPGTLAVTYDGRTVLAASLTGPFGSRIAEYRDGAVTGEDRKALLVDPQALRAVLAGVWNAGSPAVRGRDQSEYLLTWEGAARVAAVLDIRDRVVRSLELEGGGGHLVVSYPGSPDPWPGRIALRDEKTGRSLVLKLVAVEPIAHGATPGR